MLAAMDRSGFLQGGVHFVTVLVAATAGSSASEYATKARGDSKCFLLKAKYSFFLSCI